MKIDSLQSRHWGGGGVSKSCTRTIGLGLFVTFYLREIRIFCGGGGGGGGGEGGEGVDKRVGDKRVGVGWGFGV